ncbi:MAG: ATP-binding protein [Bacteroidales bacterium]
MNIKNEFQNLKKDLLEISKEHSQLTDIQKKLNDFENLICEVEGLDLNEYQYYRNFINHSPDIFFVYSNRRGVLYSSPKLHEALGFNPESSKKSHLKWLELIHPDDRQIVEQTIKDEAKGAGHSLEYRVKSKDNGWVWLRDYIIRKINSKDEIIIEGQAKDVTKEKSIEKALNISEEQVKSISNNLINGMIYQIYKLDDGTRRFTYVSDNIERFYGCSAKEAMQDAGVLYSRFHKDDLPRIIEEELAALKNMSIFKTEARIIKPNGEVRWAQFISKPHTDNGTVYFDGIEIDITEQKNTEHQLRKLIKEKNTLMQIISHDLRSPFNTLLGYSNLLLNKLDDYSRDTIRDQVEMINLQLNRTYILLENLLLWSRSQSGLIEFNPQKIVLKDIYTKTINSLKGQCIKKNIDVLFFEEKSQTVIADVHMLSTILRNLLSNAIKFTPNNGHINVFTTIEGEHHITVTVSDTGVGIDKQAQEKIWDASKLHTTDGTNNEKGTGFGLLICKELVERHGGKIWVESSPGKGSEFKFSIPISGINESFNA